MNMTKCAPTFGEKLKAWCGGEIEPVLQSQLSVERAYKKWGRADARRGAQPAEDEYFQFLGRLVFPDDEDIDMASALAEYMRICYMDGFEEGGAV